mgnify:CR=1 FL=1
MIGISNLVTFFKKYTEWLPNSVMPLREIDGLWVLEHTELISDLIFKLEAVPKKIVNFFLIKSSMYRVAKCKLL